ncbi:MAG: hypothetical protein EA426_00975 [Spirochaetaceae bacterium]|nr:MAG: hypothetical protein EA426_00975 [Spirochaetaceae bacterium]
MTIVVGRNSTWQKTYRCGAVTRGEVNRVDEVIESPAGKGSNVCRALGVYDVACQLHAYVGGPTGEKFSAACERDGIQARFTQIDHETRVCVTLIEADGAVTELVEPAPRVTDREGKDAEALTISALDTASMLAICGTAMTGESENCYRTLIRAAKDRAVPVVLDSYRLHGKRALEAGPEIVKINRDELAELTAGPVDTETARVAAYRRLADRFGVLWVVITNGKDGAEAFNGRTLVRVRPPVVSAVNPIGSGDSVTAGMLARILETHGKFSDRYRDSDLLRSALAEGVAAGTANCLSEKPGYIDRSALERVRSGLVVEHREIA